MSRPERTAGEASEQERERTAGTAAPERARTAGAAGVLEREQGAELIAAPERERKGYVKGEEHSDLPVTKDKGGVTHRTREEA